MLIVPVACEHYSRGAQGGAVHVIMGNNYTSLSTQDPNDLLVGRDSLEKWLKKALRYFRQRFPNELLGKVEFVVGDARMKVILSHPEWEGEEEQPGGEHSKLKLGFERQHMQKSATFSTLPVTRPPVHTDSITAMAVVRPGMVITGSRDKSLALNNVDTGECVTRWIGHNAEVTKVAYGNTVGNHFVLSGSRDQTVKLWQFHSREAQKSYEGHSLVVTGLAVISGMV
nr:WD40 repeat domain containing protein [Haemonchus contortus]